jgi:hypothetical protein
MTPLLAADAQVSILPARWYAPGDIVAVFAEGRGLLLHRLLGYRRHGGRWCGVTRGDHCAEIDSPTPFAHVLGRLAGHRPTWRERSGAALTLLRHALSRLGR